MLSFATDKAEKNRGSQKDTTVPVEVDHVNCGGYEDEDSLTRSKKDRPATTAESRNMSRTSAERKAKAKEKVANDLGKKGTEKSGGYKGGQSGEPQGRQYMGQCWTYRETRHKHQNVDGELTTFMKRTQTVAAAVILKEWTAAGVGEDGEVGGICMVGNVEELAMEVEGTGRPGCRSKY